MFCKWQKSRKNKLAALEEAGFADELEKSKLRNEYCKHDHRILEFLVHNARSLKRFDRFRSTLRVCFSKLPKSVQARTLLVLRTNRASCVSPSSKVFNVLDLKVEFLTVNIVPIK